MQWRRSVLVAGLVFVFVALMMFPVQTTGSRPLDLTPAPHAGVGPSHLSTAAAPIPATTFPRTVLVETFTGVWCPHCPAETQALHNIEEVRNHSYVVVAELHVCAFAPGTGPCLDNYPPPDNTSYTRGAWYNVCGYPDVYFNGLHDFCGATNSASQMEASYNSSIANASMIPGNVSISQTAGVQSGHVSSHAYILSGITGTYNAITYLMEFINLQNVNNGGGPHDIDWVVRATLANHPVSLTAGQTTEFDGGAALNSTWNQKNLSVVTLVQQNSTKIIENANMALISMKAAVSSNQSTVISSTTASITVQVQNATDGNPISGATVAFNSSAGGSFNPVSGVTASDGTFTSVFTAPRFPTSQDVVVSATADASGYTSTFGSTTLVVTPVVLPLAPTGLTVSPGDLNVTLNWTAPASGGAGLTYYIYRATSESGTYAQIGTATAPPFIDTGMIGATTYWYSVSAMDSFGFSPNSTVTPASALTVNAQGLPSNVGWWISVGAQKFSSPTSDPIYLFFPSGLFSYTFGPSSYAYQASGGSSTFTTSGVSLVITTSYTPRYANLQGTVSPASATVTVNGTPVSVSDGTFSELLVAGTYTVSATANGYESNVTTVVLTPGNLTPVSIDLNPVPGSGSSTSGSGGLSGTDMLIIIGGVVAVAAVVVAGVALSGRRKRGPRP